MKIESKPFTTKQIDELLGYICLSTQLFRAAVFMLAVAAVGWSFKSLQALIAPTSWPFWVLPTAIAALVLYVYSEKWTGGRTLRSRIKHDLAKGNCKLLIVEPLSVAEYKEIEDEGPSYLIETKEGESILLTGQYLSHYKSRKFPWSKFAIMEAPHSKINFGLKKMGESIPIFNFLPPMELDTAKELGCFEHDYILLDKTKQRLL